MSKSELTIHPMPVGAEVRNLAEGMESDPQVRKALYDVWLEHGFLLFRDVASIEDHLAISRCFGDLEIHPFPEVRYKENENFIEIGAPMNNGGDQPPAYVFDDSDIRINRIAWHRDTAYTPDICKGAMLRMLEVPEHEGETMLADTAMAWDDLPEELKRRLATLEYKACLRIDSIKATGHPGTFWNTARWATDEEDPAGAARRASYVDVDDRYPSVIQPAVLTHPESGRKCIFLSPTYVDCFIGLDGEESESLLKQLTDHMLQPEYVYRHKWRKNDAIIWDNRRCMHSGVGNLPDEPRYGLRTTLAGPTRTGRYFDPEAQAPELDAMTD
jgi:taurine dioxygenase